MGSCVFDVCLGLERAKKTRVLVVLQSCRAAASRRPCFERPRFPPAGSPLPIGVHGGAVAGHVPISRVVQLQKAARAPVGPGRLGGGDGIPIRPEGAGQPGTAAPPPAHGERASQKAPQGAMSQIGSGGTTWMSPTSA